MTCRLAALCIDAADPVRLGRFWASLLCVRFADPSGADPRVLLPDDGFALRFAASSRPKTVRNLMHFHLTTSEHWRATVSR